MATNTYIALDKITTTGSVASVTFSSINQGYTDLVIVCNAGAVSNSDLSFRVNGDTGTNYSTTNIYGTGTNSGSSRTSNFAQGYATYYGSIETLGHSNHILQFMNYSNTTTYKTVLTRANNASRGVDATVNLWRNASAINSITLIGQQANIVSGSTFSLYGIRAEGVSPAPKAVGGVISSDSTYYYHTFTSTGTFTPSQSITADYFVVAGGGGAGATVGGGWSGGGGGAGGYRTFSSVNFANATSYTATIGAGANGGSGSGGTGSTGSNSSLIGGAISTSSSGGGGGGTSKENGNTQTNGTAGGSGGGAPQNTASVSGGAGNVGNYSPPEGYAGYSYVGSIGTGQGGGASAAGVMGVYQQDAPFNGAIAFDGNPYAAGGCARWYTSDPMNASPATGNGGYSKNDGTGTNYTGGKGGSGIVVIRYAKV